MKSIDINRGIATCLILFSRQDTVRLCWPREDSREVTFMSPIVNSIVSSHNLKRSSQQFTEQSAVNNQLLPGKVKDPIDKQLAIQLQSHVAQRPKCVCKKKMAVFLLFL